MRYLNHARLHAHHRIVLIACAPAALAVTSPLSTGEAWVGASPSQEDR